MGFVRVQDLIPDKKKTRSIEFYSFCVTDMCQFLNNTSYGTYLPALMEAFRLEKKYLKEDKKYIIEVLMDGFAQFLLDVCFNTYEALVKNKVDLAVVLVKELLKFNSVCSCVDKSLEMAKTIFEIFFGVEYFNGGLLT